MHKRRIAQYEVTGRRKQDPLEHRHKLATTLSKKRLSSLQSLNRTRGGGETSIESHPSPTAMEASASSTTRLTKL